MRDAILCTLPDNGGSTTRFVKPAELRDMGWLVGYELGRLVRKEEI